MNINDSLENLFYLLFRSLLMSMKNQTYNLINEDGFDNRIPLHNDEAFQHGIQFKIKVKN